MRFSKQQPLDRRATDQRRTWHLGVAAGNFALGILLDILLLSAPFRLAGRSLRREVGIRRRILSVVKRDRGDRHREFTGPAIGCTRNSRDW